MDVDSHFKNMQKKVVVRNADTASLYKGLTATIQDTVQEEPEKERAELVNSLETQLGEVAEVLSNATTPPDLDNSNRTTRPCSTDHIARGLEEVKILLQTEVHLLITRSLEEVKCLLQEEVHGRSASERRLDERCDKLTAAVQAISSEHALQAAQAGSIEEVRSILQWLEDRWDKLDVSIAQVAAQQDRQDQDGFGTRITQLEERCKHLEVTGKVQIEVIEEQKKCLEEHSKNLDKISAAKMQPSDVDPANAPEVKRTLEEVKARCDKLNKSLAALPSDEAQTVSALTASAHERIDSLEAIVKDSFERLLQELESVKDCWRLQKAEDNQGEMVAVYSPGRPSPGRPTRLKSERSMQDVPSIKQVMSKRRTNSPREKEQSGDEQVLVLVAPVSPTRVEIASQQPMEQCREVAEASVIELPTQQPSPSSRTARHPSPSNKSRDSPMAGCSSRAWQIPSLSASVTASSAPPAPKAQSSTAGACSPSHAHHSGPTLHAARAMHTPREHFLARSPSKERAVRPQITSPLSGGRSPSLDARSPMPWPLPPQPHSLSREVTQEQPAQPPARPVGSTACAVTAAMDTRAANAAMLARAASPVRTPQMQSPRDLPRETMRACGVRSPSIDPSCTPSLAHSPRPLRGSLGTSSKAMMSQPRRCVSGYVL
mmetsp:Transcript_68234/g.134859  ORF Transcript_68234/g.134859 Transcript_68234/m.134859 type:complete len:659 (-) Transcript_68234:102-2078(-)